LTAQNGEKNEKKQKKKKKKKKASWNEHTIQSRASRMHKNEWLGFHACVCSYDLQRALGKES